MEESRSISSRSASARQGRSIAVVSGKGGSGKTMVAAELARLADAGSSVVALIDADLGTGGLTYFLNLRYIQRQVGGVADLALAYEEGVPDTFDIKGSLQEIDGFSQSTFLSVGDHRRLFGRNYSDNVKKALRYAISELARSHDVVLIDCRGGIDDESIAVCEAVDDVLLVVESDTTSYQASQHLADVLAQERLATKLRGFVINKVIDDPSSIARNGTVSFRCPYLGSIPFDLDVTRNFLVGEIPDLRSVFGIHLASSSHRVYPEMFPSPMGRVWEFKEFSEVGLTDIDAARGGVVAAAAIVAIALVAGIQVWVYGYDLDSRFLLITFFYLVIVGIAGSVDRFRRVLGRSLGGFFKLVERVLKVR